MLQREGERHFVPAIGGPHHGNTVLVYEPPPLELTIDRRAYVLDEVGMPE